MEVESRLRRAGKLPKDKRKLVVEGKSLKMTDTDIEFPETVVYGGQPGGLAGPLRTESKGVSHLRRLQVRDESINGERSVASLRGVTAQGMRNPASRRQGDFW